MNIEKRIVYTFETRELLYVCALTLFTSRALLKQQQQRIKREIQSKHENFFPRTIQPRHRRKCFVSPPEITVHVSIHLISLPPPRSYWTENRNSIWKKITIDWNYKHISSAAQHYRRHKYCGWTWLNWTVCTPWFGEGVEFEGGGAGKKGGSKGNKRILQNETDF